MFDDINLLPEDLRKKEEKEKKAKSQGLPEEELSLPQAASRGNGIDLKKIEKELALPSWLKKPTTTGWTVTKAAKERPVSFFAKIKKLFKKKISPPPVVEVASEEVKMPTTPVIEKKPILPKSEQIKAPVKELLPAKIRKTEEKKEFKDTGQITKRAVTPPKEKVRNFFGFLKSSLKFLAPPEIKPAEKVFTSGDKLTSPSDHLVVNLIPPGHDFFPLPRLFSFFLLTIIINLIIIGIFYSLIILKSYQIQLKAEMQDQRIAEKIAEIEKLKVKEKETENLRQQIKQIEEILNIHLYWTKFFQVLENYTLANVYYKNFAATSQGNITLNAITTDYQSVAKQLMVFEEAKDFAKEVKILGAAKATSGTGSSLINFNINLTINPQIFLKPLTND